MKQKLISILLTASVLFGSLTSLCISAAAAVSAFDEIGASTAVSKSGFSVSGARLGGSGRGSWAKYEAVDFGNKGISGAQIKIGVSEDYAGQTVTFRVDSKDAAPFAQIVVAGTVPVGSAWTPKWQSMQVLDYEVTGIHDLYVLYDTGPAGDLEAVKMTEAVESSLEVVNYPASLKGTGTEKKFPVLEALGIMQWDGTSDVNLTKQYTAQEFAQMALMLKGVSDANEISDLLSECGLEAKTAIKTEDACEMLVRILWENYPADVGSYYAQASAIGVKCSAKDSDKLTIVPAIELLYSATDAETAVVTGITEEGDNFVVENTVKKDNTLLMEHRKIYKDKGIVIMDEITGLDDVSDIYAGQVLIDGYVFECGEVDVSDLLGVEVEYYYQADGYSNTLIYAAATDRNTITKISARNIGDYDNHRLEYYVEDKEKNVKIAQDAAVILNGEATLGYDADTFNIDSGSITLIDNNADGTAEVIKVQNTKDYLFSAYYDGKIYLKGYETLTIDTEAAGNEVYIKNVFGISLEPETLVENSVCTVAAAAKSDGSGTVYRITIRKLQESGIIKSIDRNGPTVTIGESVLYMSAAFEANELSNISIGQEINVLKNEYGEIAFIERQSTTDKVGYLVKAWISEDDESVNVRIFTEDGAHTDYVCTENLRINGVKPTDRYSVITNTYGNQILIYSTNASGAIYKMNFAVEGNSADADNGLYHYLDVSNAIYKRTPKTVDGRIVLDESFIMFKIPQTPTDYDSYLVTGATFADDARLTASLYNREQGKLSATLGVMRYSPTDSTSRDTDDVFYIARKYEAVDERDDEAKLCIEYYNGTGRSLRTAFVNSAVRSAFDSIEIADAVRFSTNNFGEISAVNCLASVKNGVIYESDGGITDASRIVTGHIYKKDGSLITLTAGGEVFNCSSAAVYIYDVNEKTKLTVGTSADLFSSESVPTGSELYIYTYYGQVRSIVVKK